MTSTDFNDLSDMEQSMLLGIKGLYIAEQKEGDFNRMLYQLYSFYVEIYHNPETKIESYYAFDDLHLLEPYLKKVDISPIVNLL